MDKLQNYIDRLAPDRVDPVLMLRDIMLENLPAGFEEIFTPTGIEYVVPFDLYPKGYHCDKSKPLPFIVLASQKNYIAIYHLGLYAENNLYEWFKSEYPKYSKAKPDMGKGCVRFKKMDDIPYNLVAELASKISPKDWIEMYEKAFLKK